jgi:hypothetical protein
MSFLIPSDECIKQIELNSDYQTLIDDCIRHGEKYNTVIKLISHLPEVIEFTLAEWIYIADRLKFRTIWIVPAWARFTVRPRFKIKSWIPCQDILSLYTITRKMMFNNNIQYWTEKEADALNFLDFSRDYGGMYNVYKLVRNDSFSEWKVTELYRNYSTKELVAWAIGASES